MPAFLVTSGLGRKESAREIGLQSALGWSARQILEKLALEKVLISLMSVSLAILLSMAWMKVFNGFFIAQFFVAEIGVLPQVPIPGRYLPSHALSGLLLALAVTLGGGLVPAWRKTLELPRELM